MLPAFVKSDPTTHEIDYLEIQSTSRLTRPLSKEKPLGRSRAWLLISSQGDDVIY